MIKIQSSGSTLNAQVQLELEKIELVPPLNFLLNWIFLQKMTAPAQQVSATGSGIGFTCRGRSAEPWRRDRKWPRRGPTRTWSGPRRWCPSRLQTNEQRLAKQLLGDFGHSCSTVVEHTLYNLEVAGSNPAESWAFFFLFLLCFTSRVS